MKNKRGDVTVAEAANSLGVTTRSVLNYIKAKEIEALKVGKSWYINKASLDSFSKRFGFYKAESPRATEIRKGDHNFRKDEKTEGNAQAKYSVKNLRLFKRAMEILSGLTIDETDTPCELKLRVWECPEYCVLD